MTPPGLIFIDFYRFWTSFGEVFGPQIVSKISKNTFVGTFLHLLSLSVGCQRILVYIFNNFLEMWDSTHVFVYLHILVAIVFKKSIMHTSPPRCHPQGHNARGTLQRVVETKSKTNPQTGNSCKESGLRVARRGTGYFWLWSSFCTFFPLFFDFFFDAKC